MKKTAVDVNGIEKLQEYHVMRNKITIKQKEEKKVLSFFFCHEHIFEFDLLDLITDNNLLYCM